MAKPLVGRDHQLAQIERYLTGSGQAVVIHGSEGVGKTRLAREVLTSVQRRRYATTSLLATPSAASIPFAALAGLLPGSEGPIVDAASMVGVCRRHLEEQTAATPLVVLIDDAHWLDPGSLSLLQHLVELPRVRLLMTVRADAPAPGEITGLWKDDLALRVDLDPLDRAGTDQLIELTVGGPAHPATEDALWELSRGNPLFLRELLLAARGIGHMSDRPGLWELEQPLPVSPRLADLVSNRLDGLDERARLGLEVLTLVEPIGSAVYLQLLGANAVAQLEVAETIEIIQQGQRKQVRFGHPVYGEVTRATTPHGRLVQAAGLLLDTLPKEQTTRRTDHAMLAKLWSVAGRPGRPELFTEAARQALSASDHSAAEELGSEAIARGGGVEARLTYGEALVYRGSSDRADVVLEEAKAGATGDEQVARVALLQAHSALFNRGDPHRAEEVVVEASRRVDDRDWHDQLDATRALTAVARGDLRAAVAASEAVRARDDPDPRVLLGVLIVTTLAHALLGDLAAARHDVGRASPLLESLKTALPLASDQIRIVEVGVDLHDGRVADAVALADKEYTLAVDEGMPARVGAWAVTLAMTLISAGRFTDALRLTDIATSRLEVADPFDLHRTALSMGLLCAAVLPDREPSAATLETLKTAGERDLRTRIHAARAEVWVTASRGDLQRACDLAVEHGRWTVEASNDVWGAMILYDVVRFGQPALVKDDLVALSAAHDAGLLRLFADHAVALDDQDPDVLRDVGSRFAAGGAELYAAEAMAQVADVLHRQGQPRTARTAWTVASELLGRCDGVATPALLRTKDPLTTREREIAMMARRGTSSRQIADSLTLSPRTVDNHLAAIYRKTGIDGRHQLGELMLGEELPEARHPQLDRRPARRAQSE